MSTTEPQTAYQRHHQQCKAFNERLLGILYRDLAERQADFDADRHDLQLRRYHAAQVFLVQKRKQQVAMLAQRACDRTVGAGLSD